MVIDFTKERASRLECVTRIRLIRKRKGNLKLNIKSEMKGGLVYSKSKKSITQRKKRKPFYSKPSASFPLPCL